MLEVCALTARADSDRTVLINTTSCLDRARASLESMAAELKSKWAVADAAGTGLPTVQPHQVEEPGDEQTGTEGLQVCRQALFRLQK